MTDSGQANQQDFGGSSGGDVVRLISQARASLKSRDYEAAKAGFRGAYDFLNRRGLGEGLEAMECLADLGATHMALKEYDAALSEYARLATIMERNLGEANAELRQHLRRYAQACDVAGKVHEAKRLYSRANDLERRYGAVPTRSSAGGLPGRFQSGPREPAPGPASAGGGSTFAEAIQDAVARSMAKLDNRGKPFEPQETISKPQTPAKPQTPIPRPFVASPLPPSPFQELTKQVVSGTDIPAVDISGQPGGAGDQPGLIPQGFTGSPALTPAQFPATPQVPKELSDSQFIYSPKDKSAQEGSQGQQSDPGQQVGAEAGGKPALPGVGQPIGAEQQESHSPQVSPGPQEIPWPQEPPRPVKPVETGGILQQYDAMKRGIGESGSYWRGPSPAQSENTAADAGTAGGEVINIPQYRSPDQEGDYEPVSDARPPGYQSVEQSLDKVFGDTTYLGYEPGSGIHADPSGAQDAEAGGDPGSMPYMPEGGNSPVRRKTNPNLNSSKLRQLQNMQSMPEQADAEQEYTSTADSFTPSAPLSYDPADYDPATPTGPHPGWHGPTGKSTGAPDDAAANATRRPGARRASAEWGFEPPEDNSYEEIEAAESFHGADMHPDSDASKAMAQWMVPITEQGEEQYPPLRQEDIDRRQAQEPVSPDVPPGAPAPFERRQKPKSMKNLRSRFGQMEPSTNVEDAEFEESDVISTQGQASSSPGPGFAPPGQPGGNMQPPVDLLKQYDASGPSGVRNRQDGRDLGEAPGRTEAPIRVPERRLADNSTTDMTPPEMPDDMLTRPPDVPPADRARGPRGLLERTGDSSGDVAGHQTEPQMQEGMQQDSGARSSDETPHGDRPSSMISRLVSKRQHDISMQNARPNLTAEEAQVMPRIRSMVDAARANSADGKFADAARLLQKVVNELAEGGLKDSRYVADCMLLLSEAYEASGQLGQSITSFHQHALMVEKRVGVKDYESIGNWYRLAALLDKADERDDARIMYEHALGLATQHLEADDELTANIKMSYDEFLNNPERPARKQTAPVEHFSTHEVLAQNKELRTSALQQQDKPRNNSVIVWSIVSVLVLIAAGVWLFTLMGSMNKSIGNIDATVVGGPIPAEIYANTDGNGLLRFTGTEVCEITVDGKLRQVRYVVMKNDLTDLAKMFMNLSARETLWVRKAPDGMIFNDNTMFFSKDSPELAMAAEMRRIGQRVEEYYQTHRSYPRFRQDWSEDPAFGYLNPITHKGEASIFHVFPKSATQAALFGGFTTPDEVANFLESGETWVGEPELKPCSISVAVKHSGERANGKPVVFEFYMHATDQNNHFLPASKPKTVSVVLLSQGRNIGNFDLHPTDPSKLALVPMPEAVAYINMSDSPLFSSDILKAVVPVTFVGLAAIIFFSLLITLATLRSKKNTKKKTRV
jgi:tetratricopeptide (TPR) repeat protein